MMDNIYSIFYYESFYVIHYNQQTNSYDNNLMKSLIIVALLISLISSVPTNASYAKANNRPLNIAHRGLCSLLPENTLQAFQAALYQGADFFELDVVYTKQKLALVMHDPYLSRLTNVKNKSAFATRYSTRTYGGANKTDFWTDEFTLAELKTLGIKQAQQAGRISQFDYLFTFPTLDEVVEMCIQFNSNHKGTRNPDKRLGGVLIEAKDSQMYRDLYGLEIGETIMNVLKKYKIHTVENATKFCPIYLHSFDYGTIKYWSANTELPVNYLVTHATKYNITEVNTYATGLGVDDASIWNYTTQQPTALLQNARDLNMLLHVWTFKDDALFFNSSTNFNMYSKAQNLMKLDGVITEFADIYAPIAQFYRGLNSTKVEFEM